MSQYVYVCPRCGLKMTTAVEVKYPPTCSNHVGRKPVDMELVEHKEKPR